LRVHLVRHGRAEKRTRWDGPDALRPLTGEGLRHAERVGLKLRRNRPDRLLASPALRCRQTLEPLAHRLGLSIETRQWLAKGEDAGKAADLLRQERGQRIVCCSHTDMLAELESELGELDLDVKMIGRSALGATGSESERIAVVDLGSTSFHMLVADVTRAGGLHVVARSRVMLQLGSLLATTRSIPKANEEQALDAAKRLAKRAWALGATRILPVGTAALRDASNGSAFRKRLGKALGANVRLLSGVEEARLMFAAFRRRVPFPAGPVLGVDLGGGSLELALGDSDRIRKEWTLRIGVARMRAEFIQDDPPSQRMLRAVRQRVREQVAPLADRIAARELRLVVASGGTARALGRLVAGMRGLRPNRSINQLEVRTPELRSAARHLLTTPRAARLRLPGMRRRRVDLLPTGALVLATVAESLHVPGYTLTDWGLREGVLLEAVGIEH
jgi:exopolyphosphatase/guanosine-5'-triphosphate,3'-diphosphate pyrophosphatase